jgi:hypothetical protein
LFPYVPQEVTIRNKIPSENILVGNIFLSFFQDNLSEGEENCEAVSQQLFSKNMVPLGFPGSNCKKKGSH